MIVWLIELRNSIQFIDPQYLVLLKIVYGLAILWVIILLIWRRNLPKQTVGSSYPFMSRMLKFCLYLMVTLCLSVVALSRPYLPKGGVQFKRGAIEIICIVDDSASMWVKDILPSRIEIAVRELTNVYSSEVIKEGDRAALVVFGRSSRKKLRLSRDLSRFVNEVAQIG